jgi:hypothetical protein
VPAFELIIVDQSFAHPHCRLRFFFILFFLSLSPFIIVAHYTMLPKPYLNAIAPREPEQKPARGRTEALFGPGPKHAQKAAGLDRP